MGRCWLCATSSGGSVAGGHCGRCDCCRPLAHPENYKNSTLGKQRAGKGNNKEEKKDDGCFGMIAVPLIAIIIGLVLWLT